MKKKVVAMFLAAVMALSLVACGSKSDNGGSGDASGTETIKLGGVGPLTGGYANYGLSVQHGAELAVKEINAAGGVNGKQLELSFQDSQGDPESAVAAYGKLMDWGMNVSLGAVLSGETASVVAAAKADDVLVMETTGSADKCIDGNDKAFRICFYDSYQGTAAADYLTDNALATEVGVFYQSDNDYSVGLYNAFVAECQNTGVTIKETQTFTTATSTDFSTQVNALASSGVKVVFIPIYAEEASTFLTQAKGKFADDVYFFGADGLDGILGKVSQDVTIADNVLMMTPFAADSADPKVQAFVKAYEEAYGATPDQFAADAYDVPHRSKDDEIQADASSEVFKYFVCSICPVKAPTLELRYDLDQSEFHSSSTGYIATSPELGFLYPAFDNRTANIYNVLFYSKNAAEIHQEVIDALFHVDPPMSAEEQKNAFGSALADALDKDCSYDVVQSVHEQIRARIEDHKESKDPEPLEMTAGDVGGILANSGVNDEQIAAFQRECDEQYGENAALNPNNIIESKKFEITTPEVKISIAPENSYMIEARVINGRKYLLIPADDGVEVNGIGVNIPGLAKEE